MLFYQISLWTYLFVRFDFSSLSTYWVVLRRHPSVGRLTMTAFYSAATIE